MKYFNKKIGGGGHLQYYDLENGQYCEEDIIKFQDDDMKNLILYYYFGLEYNNILFHFPNIKIHNNEYCEVFVKYIRRNKLYKNPYINENKIKNYLFKKRDVDDKSKFIINILGYKNDINGWNELNFDIINNTDFTNMKFHGNFIKTLKIRAITKLKDKNNNIYFCTTIWELEENLNLKFITLLPRRID